MVEMTPDLEAQMADFLKSVRGYSHYATVEDLPEEYRGHVHPIGLSGVFVFHHPLLVQMMPLQLPAPIEQVIGERRAELKKLAEKGDWPGYMLLIQRPYRMQTLLELEVSGALGDTQNDPRAACRYWKLAAEVWTDAEHDESDPIWTAVLEAVPHIGFMTSSADRRWLRSQPEAITLYRGVQGEDADEALENGLEGVQWSTERPVAEFFARRHLRPGDNGYVLSAEVSKEEVLAYLTDRNEGEAIVPVGVVDPSEVILEKVSPLMSPACVF
jgi:hypothetical protein